MVEVKSIFINGMNISSLVSAYCDNVEDELDTIGLGEPSEEVDLLYIDLLYWLIFL